MQTLPDVTVMLGSFNLGGGKRAFQAFTPDNEVAELYGPAAFQKGSKKRKRRRGIGWKLPITPEQFHNERAWLKAQFVSA